MSSLPVVSVRDFGALGDGRADDTRALQSAIDSLGEAGGSLFVPDGIYCCSTLTLRSHVGLVGSPTWSFRQPAGAILRLADAKAQCLLDLSHALGVTLNGLCLDGNSLGEGAHGVMFRREAYGRSEDTPRIERCQIGHFTGDGVHLWHAWCFSIRHCHIMHNQLNGVRLRGWDGFLLDNWLSGNGQAGFAAYDENASVTMTGNRIEWNHGGGIVLRGGGHYNITGNYVDRSGGPGLFIQPSARGTRPRVYSITGNVFYRSGAPQWRPLDQHESCHVRIHDADGVVFSGNAMHAGRDDGNRGDWSPQFAMVLSGLHNSIVKDNVAHEGCLGQVLLDLGGHGDETIIRDNIGSVFVPPTA